MFAYCDYNLGHMTCSTTVGYKTFDVPVSLELLVAEKLFLLPGPWYDILSSRVSFMRSGVTEGHHVLDVFNQRVTGRWHDGLKIRASVNTTLIYRLLYTKDL